MKYVHNVKTFFSLKVKWKKRKYNNITEEGFPWIYHKEYYQQTSYRSDKGLTAEGITKCTVDQCCGQVFEHC